MLRNYCALAASCLLIACGGDEKGDDDYDPARDYFSFANTEEFVTRHLELDIDVDFEKEQLRGHVVLFVSVVDGGAEALILDTRDVDVVAIAVSQNGDDWQSADYRWGETHAVLGTPLVVDIPDVFNGAAEFRVKIDYATSPSASALQWLPAELTAGGEHPMMFSQSQAIHARSWLPSQDTPAVRVTYDATVRTPSALLAVMSANNDPLSPRRGVYHFNMPQPIPSYLIAIAVGNLYFAPLGKDTGVYTEPELLDASVYEFAQTQDMLDLAAKNFGPYQWGRYDLLVLPPSFPYGGMENPRLSFLTPSLLAGDRSLVSVVAHELAHSWSGNLVTNRTWRDGWLNEGMTSYLEARLMELIYDVDRVDEERVLGYEELLLNFDVVPEHRQGLAPRFDDGDPDDFQGTIHYHKGQLFLTYLEEQFGREVFDPFLLKYFDDFAFKTITTEVFLDYLDENLLQKQSGVVSRDQVKVWLYEPGLPDDAPIPTSTTLLSAASYAESWGSGEIDLDEIPSKDWSPQATVHFLNNLPDALSEARLVELDDALSLSDTGNAEIGRTWFIQVAKRRHTPAYAELEQHLNRYGRTRLVNVVYGALATNGADLELAREMFAKARPIYHPITVDAITRTLDKAAQTKE